MKLKDYQDYLSTNSENDDIQDVDLRWEQVLLLTSDPSSEKFQDSSQAQSIMTLHNQQFLRGGGKQNYHRLRNCDIAN